MGQPTILSLGSLFSGIEGFGLGFQSAGFQLKWQVERDRFCRRVLRSHWPTVHRFADVRKVGARNLRPVDCIAAGVPCQDVSVAGKRAGLAGSRTGLFYEFARILRELRPAWFVFENVPGLFSSNEGRDFAEVLRVLMVECGYGVSWRVLDSRYFGVAQRRRRVFLVGRFGEPCPAAILFDAASGERDFAARRKARARVAAPLTSGSSVSGHKPGRRCEDDWNIAVAILQGGGHSGEPEPGSGIVAATLPGCRRLQTDGNRDNLQVSYALRNDPGGIGQGHNTTYAVTENMRNRSQGPGNYVAGTLRGGGSTPASHGKQSGSDRAELVSASPDADGVRDFAGLPEGMDSARYRALGNAVTRQVAEWIARRIVAYSSLRLRDSLPSSGQAEAAS